MIDVEELKEDEEPPVILKNNGFSESVEGVLESYGLPHKGEIDPTAIMSFFYVFFFGMCYQMQHMVRSSQSCV